MPGDDRARGARAGTSRSSANASATRQRGASVRPPRFNVASVRTRAPRYALEQHAAHAGHPGDLVLVATDDVDLRRSLCQALAAQGYRAVAAPSESSDETVARIQPMMILRDLDEQLGSQPVIHLGWRSTIQWHPPLASSPRLPTASATGTSRDLVEALAVSSARESHG